MAARLTEMNDLPEPGLKDVMAITLAPEVDFDMNSTLVRSTRNASLMMSREPSFTTSELTSFCCPRLASRARVASWGISPRKGSERCSMSLRPRMRVLVVSMRNVTANGRASPRTIDTSRIIDLAGVGGTPAGPGALITRVL